MIINDPAALAEMETAFAAYEQALMDNDLDALDDLVVRPAPDEDREAVDRDAVGQREGVMGGPTGQGDSLVEAEQVHPLEPVLDAERHVGDAFAEVPGEVLQYSADLEFELVLLHRHQRVGALARH